MRSGFDALQWALERQALVLPPKGLILLDGAEAHPLISMLPPDRLRVRQDWQPQAGQLAAPVWQGEELAAALVLPAKQRDRALGDLATAALAVQPGGLVVLAAENEAGAGRFARDLAGFLGATDSISKHKARVCWGLKTADFDMSAAETWVKAAAPQPILGGAALSQPGVFAWDRIDEGSALLAQHLPQLIGGRVADLGCGWGYLAKVVANRAAGLTMLDLYDADCRAVALARQNLADVPAASVHWADVTAGIGGPYDFILSNPPFHAGQERRVDLGQGFIRAAAAGLARGGRLLLVANRALPYERLMRELLDDVSQLADAQGYKILTGVRA
jgi:16S rRNA (guanine1207-N2)-methyltransferase